MAFSRHHIFLQSEQYVLWTGGAGKGGQNSVKAYRRCNGSYIDRQQLPCESLHGKLLDMFLMDSVGVSRAVHS